VDDDLRELERSWQASGAPEDAARFWQAAARAPEPRTMLDGTLPGSVPCDAFFEVAEALLAELGDPLGPHEERITSLVTEPPEFGTETSRTDGRRTLEVERIFDGRPGVVARWSRGGIDGLPGDATLGWSSGPADDAIERYRLLGPAIVLPAIDRAWRAVCERRRAAKKILAPSTRKKHKGAP
jgi:hypothetical protein